MVLKSKVFWQLVRFGIIGVSAALVQFIFVVGLVQAHLLEPLSANVIAFIFAFQVSYWGHRYWTFAANTHHRVAIPRLLTVSLGVFAANQGLYFIFLKVFNIQYALALFIVLTILPLMTFFMNKFWVFRTN